MKITRCIQHCDLNFTINQDSKGTIDEVTALLSIVVPKLAVVASWGFNEKLEPIGCVPDIRAVWVLIINCRLEVANLFSSWQLHFGFWYTTQDV